MPGTSLPGIAWAPTGCGIRQPRRRKATLAARGPRGSERPTARHALPERPARLYLVAATACGNWHHQPSIRHASVLCPLFQALTPLPGAPQKSGGEGPPLSPGGFKGCYLLSCFGCG